MIVDDIPVWTAWNVDAGLAWLLDLDRLGGESGRRRSMAVLAHDDGVSE